MLNLNNYWDQQTAIFLIIFLVAVFVSLRKKSDSGPLPKETSNELRGLAILGVLFAHLTYGKFYGTEFLFPLGIWGGIMVNLFLFLSGFGLAASTIYHPKTIKDFYHKRLAKIYAPLWLVLVVLLLADAFVLGRFYPTQEIIFSFLGFFPLAHLFESINSPLWFLTPLLFFYLLFPLIFKAKHPRFSVALVFIAGFFLSWINWPTSDQVLSFYRSHWLALPLGVLFAVLIASLKTIRPLSDFWRWILMMALALLAWETAYHSGVGQGLVLEQAYALFTMACLALLFIFKKSKFAFLEIIGVYSFEIYLLHWPLVSRYDVFYRVMPPWLATLLYLPLLLLLAWLFNYLALLIEEKIFRIKKSS